MSHEITYRVVGAPLHYPGPRYAPTPVKRRRPIAPGLLRHLTVGVAWRVCAAGLVWLAGEAIFVIKAGEAIVAIKGVPQ